MRVYILRNPVVIVLDIMQIYDFGLILQLHTKRYNREDIKQLKILILAYHANFTMLAQT